METALFTETEHKKEEREEDVVLVTEVQEDLILLTELEEKCLSASIAENDQSLLFDCGCPTTVAGEQ